MGGNILSDEVILASGVVASGLTTVQNQSLGTTQWYNTADYETFSVDVYITGSATVQIRQSNNPNPPTDNGNQFGSNITSSQMVAITTVAKWIGILITAVTGSVTAYGHGKRFKDRTVSH